MSRAKLLGFKESSGTFEGKPYHSVKLHISEPFIGDNCFGSETSVQSLKYDNLPYIFGRPVPVSELVTYINSEIDISYDKNGKVTSIVFLADNYKPAEEPTKK